MGSFLDSRNVKLPSVFFQKENLPLSLSRVKNRVIQKHYKRTLPQESRLTEKQTATSVYFSF